MTALEITSDPIAGSDAHLADTPLVRWESCAAFTGTDDAGCASCGWLADDHPSNDDEASVTDAIIVALPTRQALRRAS